MEKVIGDFISYLVFSEIFQLNCIVSMIRKLWSIENYFFQDFHGWAIWLFSF